MTQLAKNRIEFAGLVVGVMGGLGGIAGMIGAFYLLPYRVEAVERRIDSIVEQRQIDRELLTRIEERLISVQQEIRRKP